MDSGRHAGARRRRRPGAALPSRSRPARDARAPRAGHGVRGHLLLPRAKRARRRHQRRAHHLHDLASLSASRSLGVAFIVVTFVAYITVGLLAQHCSDDQLRRERPADPAQLGPDRRHQRAARAALDPGGRIRRRRRSKRIRARRTKRSSGCAPHTTSWRRPRRTSAASSPTSCTTSWGRRSRH